VMLTSFGMFWGAEGSGAHWPGGDAALLAIIPSVLAIAIVIATATRHIMMRQTAHPMPGEQLDTSLADTRRVDPPGSARMWRLPPIVRTLILGDDWRITVGVALALALTAIMAGGDIAAWWIMPSAVFGLLALSIRRAVHQSSLLLLDRVGRPKAPDGTKATEVMHCDFQDIG
jgi:hypothetical protein